MKSEKAMISYHFNRPNKQKKTNRKQTNDIHIDAHAHFIHLNGSCGQIIHDTFDVPTIEKQKK